SAAVAETLAQTHWDEERGLYIDSVETSSGKQGRRASQHANALLLLFGAVPGDRVTSILAAITDPFRLKLTAAPPIVPEGQPFDEERDIVRANSFFSHFVYDGIAGAGRLDWVIE